jgi:hypothetical protein
LFSRIAFELLKHDATTISAFVYHLEQSFSPTPNVEELVFVLDFKEWLDPFLFPEIANMTGPHRFMFQPDGSNLLGRVLTREWSDTPDFYTNSFLARLPTGTPRVFPLRPLFHKSTKTASVAQQRGDFDKFLAQMDKYMYNAGLCRPGEQEEWEETLAELKAVEERARDVNASEPEEFEGWFPQGPEDVLKFLGHSGDGTSPDPNQATRPRKTIEEALAELDRAEAAGRLLWQGTITGATRGEVRFNVEPQDAWKETKLGNIALFSNRGTSNLTDENTIGDWEKSFLVGHVTKHVNPNLPPKDRSVNIRLFQPVIVSPESQQSIPLWAWKEIKKASGQTISTDWKDVVGMRWEPIKVVPLSMMVALEGPSYIPSPGTVIKDFLGSKVDAVKVHGGRYIQTMPIMNSRYVMKASKNERDFGFCLTEADKQRWLLLEDM